MTNTPHPTLAEATKVWTRIAALSFGGPAGQIAVMHRILVDERRWLGDNRFLHALNFCMMLPGPEATQLATYIGWLMHGVRGALIAGGLFLLPGALAMLALSIIYVTWGEVGVVEGLFFGLKAAVLAIVVEAVFRIGSRALKSRALVAIAAAAFVGIAALGLPFPLIVAAAAIAGWTGHRAGIPGLSGTAPGSEGADGPDNTAIGSRPAPSRRGATLAGIAALVLWLTPVALLALFARGSTLTDIGVFFSQLAIVTFGGAYAVLAYVGQEAVQHFGWLTPSEMLDGLGLAETTPGPLILVTQFVGFIAAFRDGGMASAIAGAALTTWVTFVPSFAFIFLGAPWIERLRSNRDLSSALAGVTAAAVGVILNLGLWFGWHFIFPEGQIDPWAAALSALAAALVFGARMGVIPVLVICGAVGIAFHSAGVV